MEQTQTGRVPEAGSEAARLHASRQYDHDLEWIRSKVLLMGGHVESQFRDAVVSLEKNDRELADRVVARDETVNRQEVELDRACTELIVRRQPAADDLRNVMATVKVITDLERIGDEATKIARSAKNRHSRELLLSHHYDTVSVMAQMAKHMLRGALDAYARMNRDRAVSMMAADAVLDRECQAMMEELIRYLSGKPDAVASGLDILRTARAIERIGDHATNIAEYVVYVVEGKDIRHTDYHLQYPGTMR